MNLYKHFLLPLSLTAMCAVPTFADETFDLGSQRSEKQEFARVPGQKIDHKGLVINPTPQSSNINFDERLDISAGIAVKDVQKKFGEDVNFLTQNAKGAKLSVDFGAKAAKKAGVKEVSGAYVLTVDKKGMSIVGYDEAGAFYGLQTLRQVVESEAANGGKVPYMSINDYPSMPYRGVVEGFYGEPWSHKVRLSLIDFYGKNKMNNYVYGPKDDPYHSSPNWRQPYPADQAKNIAELVQACKRNHVDFTWAIHPGKDIRWNKADYDSLVNKFNMMYDLGVRAFAIFFDDIEGEGTNPNKQVELLNNLTNDFVKAKGDVANLIICPTDYSRSWANPTEKGSLATYGRDLNKSVEVYYTGDVVCSDLTHDTMGFIDPLIKRPALFWWNYPVSDYCRNYILQGPVYGLDTTLTTDEVIGLHSNPMEHGEASKLALYGVADYAWNVSAYNPIDNWERGLELLVPKAADAYRTFAIHSADTETGYRRDESWETETFRVNNYTQAQFDALKAEFAKVATVHKRMEQNCENEQLLNELHPWLEQFSKLGNRGLRTLDLIKTYESGDNGKFWSSYVANIPTDEENAAYEAHKSGTMKLKPFIDNAMGDMVAAFYTKLTGKQPAIYRGIGSFRNLATNLDKLMLDNDTTTYYTSATSQKTGDWIGLDLRDVYNVKDIDIRQGRNSVDDVDYFDNTVLEVSADGKNWTVLTEPLVKVYDIKWTGEGVDARYVRIRKLESEKRSWASVRTFKVNSPSLDNLGFKLESSDAQGALAAFDRNPTTAFRTTDTVKFDRAAGVKAYTFLLGNDSKAELVEYDKKGKVVATTPIATAFAKVSLSDKTVSVALNGTATVYEVISE
jgi:hyaluronoglucosaminidase